LRTLAILICATLAARAAADDRSTIVTPLPEEDILQPCEYRLASTASAQPVRAVWVIYDRGPDYRQWFESPRIRKFADSLHLALVLALHCRSKQREDMNVQPEMGVARSLFTALDQLGFPESTPVLHLGWSGAGSLVARMAAFRPERYLGGIAFAPGQYDPLGMDTIHLPKTALQAPQLIIANGADPVNGTERPYDYFRRHFKQGAPWTFAVQNRTSHCCLWNAADLILEWIRATLGPKLPAPRFGFFTKAPSIGVVDHWKHPLFNAGKPRVGTIAKPHETPAGRMPSPSFAKTWKHFERH
jgi:pimeloyl-ACP methyl ester carboxylesterase